MKYLLLLMSCIPCLVWADMADHLKVEGAYVRANPAGHPVTAAYMQLHNPSGLDIVLTGVSSPIAEEAEIHTNTMEHGVMHMEPMQVIEIKAHTTVELAPGGLHLMLMGLNTQLEPGGTTTLILRYQDGSEQLLSVPVQR